MTISDPTDGVYRRGSDRVDWYLVEADDSLPWAAS
jgi:hypothetical protein